MKLRRLNNHGYTSLELLTVLLVFATLAGLFIFVLRQNASDVRDTERKRDLNAIYFSLESNKTDAGYPENPNKDNLRGVDPEALVDPSGISLGSPNAQYRYYPSNCSDGFCKNYELKVNLEQEAEFVKTGS